MKKISKTFLSAAVILFISLSFGSCTPYTGTFKYTQHAENPADSGNFLVKNDGNRIYGNEITWKSSSFTHGTINIDNQQFGMADVRGYMKKGIYYGLFRGTYIQRILHGKKINIYVTFNSVTVNAYYAQRGEDGEMIKFSQPDIVNMVKDCPQAVKMASLTDREMNNAIKNNPSYLNSIFDVYNNCNN
jgi:hypothetical protein